jgi:flagellar biosynthesis chaperone FliJ
MKTPYCTALKVQRREVDQLRISIGVEVSRVTQIETQQVRLQDAVSTERVLAAEAWTVPTNSYFQRMRTEREQLEHDRKMADAKLDQLRAQAREAYGSLMAVESAATGYREQASKLIEAAEQVAVDDRAAADFVRAVRLVRAANGRSGS